jgi:hypothetical protein
MGKTSTGSDQTLARGKSQETRLDGRGAYREAGRTGSAVACGCGRGGWEEVRGRKTGRRGWRKSLGQATGHVPPVISFRSISCTGFSLDCESAR